uniref:uncharacterized protein LOC105349845 n=1 Tax=Fragaria vesca subsp. vesca TaxID=101020 RepID=UPI0005CACE96|nr:PREDICTED: uncharacterized protein LOC105349845 [Fragaria vesca subsp. vesca]
MAASSSLSKRSIFNISKSFLKEHPSSSVQSLLSRACSSTSYERAQDPGNRTPLETREHERDVTIDNMSGVTGFVADAVRDGAAKTTEVAEDLVDLAKETMDSAYDNTKKTTKKVSETLVAEADENVVDTSEYRSIEDLSKHH